MRLPGFADACVAPPGVQWKRAANALVKSAASMSRTVARAAEGDRAALDEVESAILAALQSNTRSELARPSMGQDMLKGRRTEIDFINGLIAAKGQEVGRPAPRQARRKSQTGRARQNPGQAGEPLRNLRPEGLHPG